MNDLKDRVAVITGGASGIGFAMAEKFAAEGMRLVISDIEETALQKAVDQLKAKGAEAIGVRTDVADWQQVKDLADTTLKRFGKVHIVVNNAGVSILGPTWEMSLDDWRWVYDVNFWGVVHGIKAFVPILRAQGEPARVINTASLAGWSPVGTHAPYSSSKAAVVSLSESLYSELKDENSPVGVSCLCPGMVATNIHRSWRNRPSDDTPWSEREFTDPGWIASSEYVQRAGIAPEAVADAVLQAIREDRFWIWSNPKSLEYIATRLEPLLKGEDPQAIMAEKSFDPNSWAEHR